MIENTFYILNNWNIIRTSTECPLLSVTHLEFFSQLLTYWVNFARTRAPLVRLQATVFIPLTNRNYIPGSSETGYRSRQLRRDLQFGRRAERMIFTWKKVSTRKYHVACHKHNSLTVLREDTAQVGLLSGWSQNAPRVVEIILGQCRAGGNLLAVNYASFFKYPFLLQRSL